MKIHIMKKIIIDEIQGSFFIEIKSAAGPKPKVFWQRLTISVSWVKWGVVSVLHLK